MAMIRNIKCLILFFCLLNILDAKADEPKTKYNICYVKLNMQDCQNCFSSLEYLNQISKQTPLVFVLKKAYEYDKEKIKNIYLSDTTHQQIIFSDSLYLKFNKILYSCVAVVNNGVVTDEFPLRELKQHINCINIPDTLYFKNRIPVNFISKRYKNKLHLFDFSSSEIISYKLDNPEAIPNKFSISNKFKRLAYIKHFKDTNEIHQMDTLVKGMRIPPFIKPHKIVSFDFVDDTMFILLESLYPKKCFFQNKFDTCFFNFYTLFKVLNNKIIASYAVRNNLEDSSLIYTYEDYYIEGINLSVIDTGLFIPISRKLQFKNNYFIGFWKLIDEEYRFISQLPIDLPKLSYKYGIGYGYNNYILKYPYLMRVFSTELIDLRDNSIINLELKNMDKIVEFGNNEFDEKKLKYTVSDFIVDNNNIKLLYSLKGKSIINTYSRTKNKLLASTVLYEFDPNNPNQRCEPFFETNKYVIMFPDNGDYLVKRSIE